MDTRYLPNEGLTAPQMAQAIRKVDLEPFLVKPSKEEDLKSTLYAYLRGKVPILMGVLLVDGSKDNFTTPVVCDSKHAVAVTGYSLGGAVKPNPENGFLLKASKIDKIYAHDDQVGPFSRIVMDIKTIEYIFGGRNYHGQSLGTSWIGGNGIIGSIRAIMDFLLIPLYRKIRIPFTSIHDVVMYFDGYIEALRNAGMISLKERLLWDIYLTKNNDIKQEIFNSTILHGKLKRKILMNNLPRYLWRASALYSDGSIVLDLLFDTTDIEQANYIECAIGYNQDVFDELVYIAQSSTAILSKTNPEWKVFQYFVELT